MKCARAVSRLPAAANPGKKGGMLKGKAWASLVAIAAIGLGALGAQGAEDPKDANASKPDAPAATATPAASAAPASPPAATSTPVTATRVTTATAKPPEPPPRPPLPYVPPPPPPAWNRHLEVGPVIGAMIRPVSRDKFGLASPLRIKPAIAWGAQVRWDVIRYLNLTLYLTGANHGLEAPPGSLGLPEQLLTGGVNTYAFGLRVTPTLPIGSRVRVWITGGAGWGRLSYGRMAETRDGAPSYAVWNREASMVEFPLGGGASLEVIPRWLNVHLELTGAFVTGQRGTAFDVFQAIDAEGKKRWVRGLPVLDASIAPLLGVSMIL